MEDLNTKTLEIIQKHKFRGRRRQFIINYVKCHNASKAYEDAGYESRTVSSLTTDSSRLLTYADIKNCIKEIEAMIWERSDITKENFHQKIIEELERTTGEVARARYWDMIGRELGILKATHVIATGIMQQISEKEEKEAKDSTVVRIPKEGRAVLQL